MPRIFISYRRADSSGYVLAIDNELLDHYQREQVFRDINTIEYGQDFVEAIETAVGSCDVLLAIIGPQWLNVKDEAGQARLNNPHDFVRLEILTALQRDIRVIPVLVGGAAMPRAEQLPPPLAKFARLNAMELDDRDFKTHMGRLLAAIQQAVSQASTLGKEGEAKESESVTMPLPQWCIIPAGGVQIAGQAYQTPQIRIAKFPVTVEQYAYFVKAGGYTQADYWTEAGWAWRGAQNVTSPRFWEEADWRIPNHPIVGISWYEAAAFCRWFSQETQLDIRLPSESEWQRAAQGDTGYAYPWGPEFDPTRCNTVQSDLGRTSPVTQYPTGASPYGVQDMVGNVWEWCANVIDEVAMGTDAPEAQGQRVVRGGSWDGDPDLANVRFRGRFKPDTRNRFIGFRIVFGSF
jgi:formylglycine-generating enzyme required for sulfatase activity